MSFALASILGFMLRWSWRISGSPLAHLRLTKIAPHVIDTLFLAAGVALTFTIHQYPFYSDWLTAKIIGLLAYIVLGMFAMSAKLSRPWRVAAFLAAISIFGWIVSVALSKSPWGFLHYT